jgi:hypothetical protein
MNISQASIPNKMATENKKDARETISEFLKTGISVGNIMLKISYMRKRLFPADHVNIQFKNLTSD